MDPGGSMGSQIRHLDQAYIEFPDDGTSKKNSDSMIQRLIDESTAQAEGTVIQYFNSLQMC